MLPTWRRWTWPISSLRLTRSRLHNVMRADTPRPSLDREEVLAVAPDVEDHRFRVPRIGGEAP